jgi:hypothetical protein
MDHTKIIELFIDDEYEEAGIEAISLVSRPAHDETWLAFNSELQEVEQHGCGCGVKEKFDDEEVLNPYTIVEDDFCNHNPKLDELGEKYGELIGEGWEIVRVEKMTPTMVYSMQQQKFSNPNADSQLDTEEIRVRYKYVGPRDELNRKFCADMMSKNRVYRIEDIESLSNPEFGSYNIFLFRGSYNCRHAWVRLVYKKQGTIVNKGLSQTGVITSDIVVGPDTRNRATKANPSPTSWKPGVSRNGLEDRDYMSEQMGLEDSCWEGYEAIGTKILDGKEVPNCVPIKMTEDDFAESISDYPEGVKNAAKRAVDYAEKNGWGSCGTDVGKQRASQLAKGENISIDTIKRMYSYLSRHKVDLKTSKDYKNSCGKLMYDAWGGEAGLTWSERKLESLQKEKMTFAFDEEKKIIIGAAMVPNRMIHRYDALGNLYYVFFSAKSIKMMSDRFLKQRRSDETNIEHDGKKLGADKVFINESWISEDETYDKSAKYGFSLPVGTWYVSMKVLDDKVWKMIKEKSLTGFSVEGLFAEKSVFSKEDKKINQIKSILKSINDE